MDYRKYMHIERLGREEVDGILNGEVFVFPKIDGTNGVLFLGNDGKVHAGSRRQEIDLSTGNDNQGFAATLLQDKNIEIYLKAYPNHYIYGEWLVKHSIGYYNPDAWRKFYIFDVYDGENERYLPYAEYVANFNQLGITDVNIIPLIGTFTNPTVEEIESLIGHNHYLIDGTEQIGEGIVIKNYDFHNMYGRTTFAKIVAKEFLQNKKELHQKNKEAKTSDDICIKAVNDFLTDEMIEKEYSKLLQEMKPAENRSKFIGMLLNRIWHEFLTEEIADIDKKYKHPTLNLRALRVELENKVKSVKKELF